MRILLIILTIFFLAVLQDTVEAAGIAQRQQAIQQQREQIQRQRQQAYQQEYQQRQRQAYQQAQQQLYTQQQQLAYQQALRNRAIQQQQQQLQQRQQQQAQIQYQRQQAANQQQAYNQNLSTAAAQQRGSSVNFRGNHPQAPVVDEVVNITDIWDELEISSEVWPLIIDAEPKRVTIKRAIEIFKSKGIYIRKSPSHYIGLIDSMAQQNPKMLENPFIDIMKFVAIIEYDFDNGTSNDYLARQILGEEAYQNNLKRLGK